jgi:hypothetical protein
MDSGDRPAAQVDPPPRHVGASSAAIIPDSPRESGTRPLLKPLLLDPKYPGRREARGATG